jgi:hypothetical protein
MKNAWSWRPEGHTDPRVTLAGLSGEVTKPKVHRLTAQRDRHRIGPRGGRADGDVQQPVLYSGPKAAEALPDDDVEKGL